jgi:hypothetical protein
MTPPEIIRKLTAELDRGITTEPQVVYLMAGVRKLLEQQQATEQYEYLKFYCDWVLHPELGGPMAQKILKLFDEVAGHLREGAQLQGLPPHLRSEIDRISKMTPFQNELNGFLQTNGLPILDDTRSDGWMRFLRLYANVVEDCPLVMRDGTKATVDRVTLKVESAKESIENEIGFKVTWEILDKYGLSGSLFVINSFSIDDPA